MKKTASIYIPMIMVKIMLTSMESGIMHIAKNTEDTFVLDHLPQKVK